VAQLSNLVIILFYFDFSCVVVFHLDFCYLEEGFAVNLSVGRYALTVRPPFLEHAHEHDQEDEARDQPRISRLYGFVKLKEDA
jgi:hypothetical protein